MLVRTSRTGNQFLGCSGYPECKTTISINYLNELESEAEENKPQVVEEKCEKCNGDMLIENRTLWKVS